jgi:hypothetical protein
MAWGPIEGAETAAQRYARDVDARGGEVEYAEDGTASLVADGRNLREFDERGGDVNYDEDGVRTVDVNGRNEREYVNAADGTSPLATAYGPTA